MFCLNTNDKDTKSYRAVTAITLTGKVVVMVTHAITGINHK